MLDIIQTIGIAMAALTGVASLYLLWRQTLRDQDTREASVSVQYRRAEQLEGDWWIIRARLDVQFAPNSKYRPDSLTLLKPRGDRLAKPEKLLRYLGNGDIERLPAAEIMALASRTIDLKEYPATAASGAYDFDLVSKSPNASSKPLMRLSWSHFSSRSRKTTKVISRKLPENIINTMS